MLPHSSQTLKLLKSGAAVVVGPAEEPLASATADNVLEVPSGADTSANEEKNENVDKQGLAEVDPKDVAPSLANPKTPKVGLGKPIHVKMSFILKVCHLKQLIL